MPFKWTNETEKEKEEGEKQQINNIAEQQIKNQVKQMKTESFSHNQFNEFSKWWITKIKHIQSC